MTARRCGQQLDEGSSGDKRCRMWRSRDNITLVTRMAHLAQDSMTSTLSRSHHYHNYRAGDICTVLFTSLAKKFKLTGISCDFFLHIFSPLSPC